MNPTGRFGGTGESRSIRGAPAFGFSVTSGAYKSLKAPLEWADIPPFAIITGLNGAGKTQLLQAIAIQYDPGLKSRFVPTTDFATAISGHSYNSHDVYYVSTFSQAFTRDRLLTSQYGEQLGNLRSENYVDVYETAIRNAARTLPLAQFPLDALYLNLHAIERAIVYQFMDFLVKDGNLARNGQDRTVLGTPPWEEINDSLSRAAFPYRFVAPQGLSLVEPLILEVYNVETGEEVPLRELSAGEMSLMRFFLFGFATGKMDDEPKLFLLDEPDSHLHATLIQSFTNGIHEILVNKFGYRVIMTTHRTETIAFTPDDCIFEMHRHGQRIRKSPSKPHTIDLLSNNLIALVANRRPIFVEDKDDADFYNLAMQIMLEDGHWNLNEARPHFIPASTGKGASSRPVGATGVRQWVRRFRDVVEVTRGLVDRDKSNKEEPGLIVLDRHELENYLVDPINTYIFLAAATNSPLVARVGIPVARGREADLGQRSSSELQVIADAVLQALQDRLSPAPSAAECEGVTVEFVNGRSIEVPRWLIERGGKELIGCAKGEWPSIQRGALQEAFARARLVPCSLRKVLKRCVSHEVPDMPAHQACQDSCRIEAPTGS